MNSEDEVVFLNARSSIRLPMVGISLLGLASITDHGTQPLQAENFLHP